MNTAEYVIQVWDEDFQAWDDMTFLELDKLDLAKDYADTWRAAFGGGKYRIIRRETTEEEVY